ncbi:MAG: glutamine synthetase [Thermomicrobiales bacterium]|nr:glutamine synthetase [Thermomicrobiales bacterium]
MSELVDIAWPDIDGRLQFESVAAAEANAAELEIDPAELGWVDLGGPLRPLPDGPRVESPWNPGRAAQLCVLVERDGGRSAACTRTVLARAIAAADAIGLRPVMAAEVELLLRDSPGGEPVYPNIDHYGIVAGAPYEPIMRRLRGLRFESVRVTASNPEYGPGQFEINLSHGPAMTAADAVCLLRAWSETTAAAAGLVADFSAKPGAELSGNGLHVHQSHWRGDRNAFWEDGLSAAGRSYLAGLLDGMPELAALGSPSEDAYRRREDGSFCPTAVCWGGDNRTVAVRALDGSEGATRLEQRDAAADANPYLTFAGQLQAGLRGIERGADPGPATSGNAYDRDDLPQLPTDLGTALDLLERSDLGRVTLGADSHAALVATLRERVGGSDPR